MIDIEKLEARTPFETMCDHTVEYSDLFWESISSLITAKILVCDVYLLEQPGIYAVEMYYSWRGKVQTFSSTIISTHEHGEQKRQYFQKVATLLARHLNRELRRG